MGRIVGENVAKEREILVEEEENLGPEISDNSGENASPVNLILPLLTTYFDNHTEPVLKIALLVRIWKAGLLSNPEKILDDALKSFLQATEPLAATTLSAFT